MGIDNWLLLGRLKKVIKKVGFILNFKINRWRFASSIVGSSSRHQLSFNDRSGLSGCIDGTDGNESGSSRGRLQSTISYVSDEDIDKRADMFIANFYQQLQIERQVSLELQYCRGNSMESTCSDS